MSLYVCPWLFSICLSAYICLILSYALSHVPVPLCARAHVVHACMCMSSLDKRGTAWCGNSHMLCNRYQGNAPTNCYRSNDIRGNAKITVVKQWSNTGVPLAVCWDARKGFHLRTGGRRSIHERCHSQLDASHRLARTFQPCSSRGTFCKHRCNHRLEQVGEDFSGNQPH
jgi:hypothetical protein